MDNFLKKIFREGQYEMEDRKEQGTSSSFRNVEDELNLLIQLPEDQLLPTFAPILVQEKIKYFKLLAENIELQKANFLSDYKKAQSSIDELFDCVRKLLKDRHESLQKELLNKKNQKMALWNKQIYTCEFIQEWLKQVNKISHERNQHSVNACLSEFTKDIELIDHGLVSFQFKYEEIVECIRNMGTIIHSDNLKIVVPKFIIGKNGYGDGEFCRPWGISTDSTGYIFVSDRSNHRVQVFNEIGEYVFHFGQEGSQPGEFNRPAGIAVNIKNQIIVADKDNHRIQIFTCSGRFVKEFGSQGEEPGKFMYPWGVATNNKGDIAVADSKNHRVQLFDDSGCLIKIFDGKKFGINRPRTQFKILDCPRGLAFRPDGSLLVTDFNNHRILIINKNFQKFKSLGCEGSEPGQFLRPQGIATSSDGKIAVADCKNYRVQLFDSCNRLVKVFGSQGKDPGQFDCPQGISFHPNGSILVVDFNNDRVQIF